MLRKQSRSKVAVVSSAICSESYREVRRVAHGFHHEGRLVAFAAIRDGREIGRIGLDQKPVVRRDARGFAHVSRLRKCQMPPKLRWKPSSRPALPAAGRR